MKRKFSFSSLRLKFASAPTEDAITPEGLDSPPYSPTPSCMERPFVPPDVIAELRVSCAIVVNETNPPEYDDVPDHREMLKKYIQERDAHKAQAERRAAREKRFEQPSRSHRRSDSTNDATQTSYRHVPQNAASNFEATTKVRKPSFGYLDLPSFEPLEPTHTTASGGKIPKPERDEALERIRAALDTRPKTSAAACIDYSGPSVDSSKSNSRSTTTIYDEFGRPSTGQTSLAITPGEEKRTSYGTGRVTEQILRDGESTSLADATAREWMAHELARRRAEYQSTGQAARPASRATSQRPGSRAGSLAESVIEGVRDYIRPRASMDSMRSDYNGLSRTHSRSGSIKSNKSNTWQRVKGLRKKNSWSSFRSARPEAESANNTASDGQPNLNRALPALPGLDQYKEKKPKPTHIAQMMGGGVSGRARSVPNAKALQQMQQQQQQQQQQQEQPKQVPVAVRRPNGGVTRNMSNPEESRRQEDLRRAVEEKMRMGAIAESQHLRPHPLVQGNKLYTMGSANISSVAAPGHASSAQRPSTMGAMPMPPPSPKWGLRKKLSRFWSFDKKQKGGNMVATN
ncbi:MAG: hypothetical protein LQ352_007889 [Teloschistes flavicans]|nr:MAG: hypothetical protein LQ352_007889 [Teloschistes flavicans]